MITMNSVAIRPFEETHQRGVEELVLPIQQGEFGVPITREQQPDLMFIQKTFQTGKGNFWVALDGERVVGTIGVVDISNNQVALKKMFVAKDYRGKEKGLSQLLMDTAISWCKAQNIQQVFLGTTDKMYAAHRFYEKNGYVEVQIPELPPLFPVVSVDTKFYRLDIS